MGALGRPKRRTGALVDRRLSEAEANKRAVSFFTQFFISATTLKKSAFVFDAKAEGDRERLIDLIWSGEYREALESEERINPHPTRLLFSLTSNSYVPKPEQLTAAEKHHTNLFSGIFSVLTRTKSQDSITVLPVLLALQAYSMKVPGRFTESLGCFFRGALMSDSWVEDFIADAMKRDPGARYVSLDGVGLAVFDNCTIQVGYKSYSADGMVGYRMDMTNWAHIAIPRTLFGLQYDLATICGPLAPEPARYTCIHCTNTAHTPTIAPHVAQGPKASTLTRSRAPSSPRSSLSRIALLRPIKAPASCASFRRPAAACCSRGPTTTRRGRPTSRRCQRSSTACKGSMST